jgi:Poly(R)-hydroxyalkanoic acid synthase subunit (PHA_synth_III_E)
MDKENKFDFNTNWYDLWMKQSKEFFDSADKNLKDVFGHGAAANPEDHLKQIQQWLETLKNQWQFAQLNEQQRAYETYWKSMMKMCSDASDKMLSEWIKRSHDNNPIKNVQELYELWLNCCHEVYQKAMHTKSHQEVYGEMMDAALKFWKSAIPK